MTNATHKVPVAISACLLGENVRYDGRNRLDSSINKHLTPFLDFQAYCPEIAIGMGVPRKPIQLVKINSGIRVMGVGDANIDVTDQLRQYATQIAEQKNSFYGYIFKARSPSCGTKHVRTYSEKGELLRGSGVGVYANAIMLAHPNLPVEEENELHDPVLRNNFVERILIYYHWKQILGKNFNSMQFTDFHTRHKRMIQNHNQAACRRMGQLLANTDKEKISLIAFKYETELMNAMK